LLIFFLVNLLTFQNVVKNEKVELLLVEGVIRKQKNAKYANFNTVLVFQSPKTIPLQYLISPYNSLRQVSKRMPKATEGQEQSLERAIERDSRSFPLIQ
jgi:hypothetical protein